MSDISALYNIIFNSEGKMNKVGNNIKKLFLCELKKIFPQEKFGNINTGVLDINKINIMMN